MDFAMGFIGFVLAELLFGAGAFIGWKVHGQIHRATAEALTQTQKQRIKEEQEAWNCLHNYSVDDAYGVPRNQQPGKE